MFRSEGTQRTHRQNQAVAAYLATVAGMVNSAGFVLIGSFTSHVTGNVGRFADDLAMQRSAAPLFALLLVIAFFSGGFLASMALERSERTRPQTYSALLFVEAGLLVAFALLSYAMDTHNDRYRDVQAILLCAAMGLQNSLVTRLSGAVVRTTHLTGVVTDLAIESARAFRAWRYRVAQQIAQQIHLSLPLVAGKPPTTPPSKPRMYLHLTIVGGFSFGSVVGALGAVRWGQFALLVPAVTLLFAGAYAINTLVRGERPA
ncbi:MAG: YoaK family protein [Kofleriaceae bacterium]